MKETIELGLFKFIKNAFNIDEVKTLCFQLGIDYEILSGEGKDGMIREFIKYCIRRSLIADLLTLLQDERPELNYKVEELKYLPSIREVSDPSLNEKANLDKAVKNIDKGISLEILHESISNTDEDGYRNAKSSYDLAFRSEPSSTRLQFYEKLSDYLSITSTIFRNQIIVRDQLFNLLKKRFHIEAGSQYEEIFESFHQNMDNNELKKFNFIREITHDIAKYNSQMLKLLDDNKDIFKDGQVLKDLHDHLTFWLAKYRGQKDDPHMSIVYTGVDEDKGFPSEVDTFVQIKINSFKPRYGDTNS